MRKNGRIVLTEIKATYTYSPKLTTGIKKIKRLIKDQEVSLLLVYGGQERFSSEEVEILPWSEAGGV